MKSRSPSLSWSINTRSMNVENEWKLFRIDNIPSDILVKGAWEWEIDGPLVYGESYDDPKGLIAAAMDGQACRIRRPQPKAPTNEEIMTKWWKLDHDNDGYWVTPIGYARGLYRVAYPSLENPVANVSRDWFIDRESSDIPPEGE